MSSVIIYVIIEGPVVFVNVKLPVFKSEIVVVYVILYF